MLGRLLIIVWFLSLIPIVGNAQSATPNPNWVNIKNPKFGAIGNGSHDDTAAIQAAIDYAFAHNLPAVYCPAGAYVTSNTIWLDPPNSNDMRAVTWKGTGYINGASLTITSTVSGTLAGVGSYIQTGNGAIGSVQPVSGGVTGATIITAGAGPYTVNNSQAVGSSGSPVALTGTTPGSVLGFQFSMAFFGDPAGGGAVKLAGCQIKPTFNNAVAFMVGTGQGMRVSDISVEGPPGTYRKLQPPTGVGIGLAGGNGGSSGNLIENTYVANFYSLYSLNANNACCLDDSNKFHKAGGYNGYYGFLLQGTESYIVDIEQPEINNTTIQIDSEYSHQVNVMGGNLSTATGVSGAFTIGSVSSFFQGASCTESTFCFTATITGADGYWPAVYNRYMIVTPNFGVVPLDLLAWNPGTGVGTFGFNVPWFLAEYGLSSSFIYSGILDDLQAATTIYAAEQVVVAKGEGINIYGSHLENPDACTTLFYAHAVWAGQVSNQIKDIQFNYDPSGIAAPSPAQRYCQQSFPFIYSEFGGISPTSLKLEGGNWAVATNPLIISQDAFSQISGYRLGLPLAFNMQIWNENNYPFSQIGSMGQLATQARGAGTWDNDYFLPIAAGIGRGDQPPSTLTIYQGYSEIASPFCGYEPCPWTTSDLSATNYALVSGTLGPLGAYPPIACRTIFKSVDWNTGSQPHLFLRSASCPGYSWGQNLTNSLVGGPVAWSYKAGSNVLYLDAKTLSWMFPGLGISINNGVSSKTYIVTGVYPYLGYVTVIWADQNAGAPLQGTSGTVYSCSSSCTIGQAPYSWTAY